MLGGCCPGAGRRRKTRGLSRRLAAPSASVRATMGPSPPPHGPGARRSPWGTPVLEVCGAAGENYQAQTRAPTYTPTNTCRTHNLTRTSTGTHTRNPEQETLRPKSNTMNRNGDTCHGQFEQVPSMQHVERSARQTAAGAQQPCLCARMHQALANRHQELRVCVCASVFAFLGARVCACIKHVPTETR